MGFSSHIMKGLKGDFQVVSTVLFFYESLSQKKNVDVGFMHKSHFIENLCNLCSTLNQSYNSVLDHTDCMLNVV